MHKKEGQGSSISCPSAVLVWTLLGIGQSNKKGNRAEWEVQFCELFAAFESSFMGSLQDWAPGVQSLRQTGL